MRLKLFLSIFIFAMSLSTVSASFPVKRHVVNNESREIIEVAADDLETPMAAGKGYDKWVALAFLVFLGWPFAAHRWYAKKPVGWNILFIVTIAGLGVWAIVDLINILTDNFQK